MKRIIYTRPDGGVSIIVPASKESVEKTAGPLTEEQYEQRVRNKSLPVDAIKPRDLDLSDYPPDRELRNAWVDVTPESKIDIDCTKAKDIRLAHLRRMRNKLLADSDIEMTRALEDGDNTKIANLKTSRKALRDATEPLKALNTAGKVNDAAILQQMREMSLVYGSE